jgi:hypothetical protein
MLFPANYVITLTLFRSSLRAQIDAEERDEEFRNA